MKAKKTLLFDDDESIYDFSLIGISCHLKDYRLSWSLNTQHQFNFEKSESNLILHSKLGKSNHSLFEGFDEETGVKSYLIKNRGERYLATELKHADYFFKTDLEVDLDELIKKIKATKGVLAVFTLDVNELKSKDNFIF